MPGPLDDLFGPSAGQGRLIDDIFGPSSIGKPLTGFDTDHTPGEDLLAEFRSAPREDVDPAFAADDLRLQQAANTREYLEDVRREVRSDRNEAIENPPPSWLTQAADVLRSLPSGAVKSLGSGMSGLAETQEIVTRNLNDLRYSMAEKIAGKEVADELTRVTPGGAIVSGLGAVRGAVGERLEETGESIGAPEDRQNNLTRIADGFGQIGTQLAAVVAGGGSTSLAMLFGQGADQMADMTEETGNEGSWKGDLATIGGGALTAALEKTGLDRILDRAPPAIRNNIVRRLTDYTLGGTIEATTEVVEGIAQDAVGKVLLDPNIEIGRGAIEDLKVAGPVGFLARMTIDGIGGRNRALDRAYREKPAGIRESAAEAGAAEITPEDEASPLPTEFIQAGKAEGARGLVTPEVDSMLRSMGLPPSGTRVDVVYPDGSTRTGTVSDAYEMDGNRGAKIEMDDGTVFDEFADQLAEMGVTISQKGPALPDGDEAVIADIPKAPEPESPLAFLQQAAPVVDPVTDPLADRETAGTLAAQPPRPSSTDDTLRYIIRDLEGGGQRVVDSGGVTRFGISKKANPDVDVENLTEEQALEIYRERYVAPMGLENADPDLALVAIDAGINHGVERAKGMVAAAGGDPAKLIELRRQEYARLVAENPKKYARYKDGWENRLKKLEGRIGEDSSNTPNYAESRRDGVIAADSAEDLDIPNFGLDRQDAPTERAEVEKVSAEPLPATEQVSTERGNASTAPQQQEPPRSAPREMLTYADFTTTQNGQRISSPEATAAGIRRVETALDAGQAVTLVAEGRPVNIVRVDGGGLIDDQGQRWGTLAIQSDNSGRNRIEIAAAPAPNVPTEPAATSPAAAASPPEAETGAPETPAGNPAGPAPTFDPAQHVAALGEYVGKTKGSLSVDKIAKALGLPAEQANKVLGAYAARPDSPIRITRGRPEKRDKRGRITQTAVPSRIQRKPKRSGPVDFLTWVRDVGGVRNDEGHDLYKGMGLGRHPGLIRRNGRSVDEIGELAHEAGFFIDRPTEADVLAMFERADVRKTYRPEEQADAEEAQRARETDGEEAHARADILSTAEQWGLVLDPSDVDTALDHVARGESVETALELAMAEAKADVLDDIADFTENDYYGKAAESVYEGQLAERRDRGAEEGVSGARPAEGAAGARDEADAQPDGAVEAREQGDLDPRLPNGYRLVEGRGLLGKGKWGVRRPSGSLVWNLHDTKEEAVQSALARLQAEIETATRQASDEERIQQIGERLLAGGEPTDSDLRFLDLKENALFEYVSPVVQKLFGISNRRVREAMGDALYQTDKGGFSVNLHWAARTKEALRNAAEYARRQAEQLDAFGTRAGDGRTALERQGEGRLRSDKRQKAPGEDGGLFDSGARQDELFSRAEGEPVARLTGEELGFSFRGPADMPRLRKAAQRYYRENLVSRSDPVVTSEGHRVKFNARGLRESTSGKGHVLLQAVPAIPDILERGTLIDSMPGTDSATRFMHVYAADVEIAGEAHRIGVLVRETNSGEFQYDLIVPRDATGSRSSRIEGDDVETSVSPETKVTPGGLNLFLLAGDFNDADVSARWASTREDLLRRLESLNIREKVKLETVDLLFHPETGLPDQRVAGRYFRGVITAAMDSIQNPDFTIDHEAFHFLDERLLKPAERTAMNKAARADPVLMASIKKRYGKLDEAGQMAEARADLFAMRARIQPRGFIRDGFDRIIYFLKSLGAAVRANFLTAEDVVRAIERGDIGGRSQRLTRGERERLMVAWHGSPHDFDSFSTDAIGTGEGAQVYGWGLYFAGKKEVAEFYRKKLSGNRKPTALWNGKTIGEVSASYGVRQFTQEMWDSLEGLGAVETAGSVDAAIANLRDQSNRPSVYDIDGALSWLEVHKDEITVSNPGSLFQVDIPEDTEYLLWDRGLSEQPEQVQQALAMIPANVRDYIDEELDGQGMNPMEFDDDAYTGRHLYNMLKRAASEGVLDGDIDVSAMNDEADPKEAASRFLHGFGIAGIKYLDGGSRSAGDGTYNYVVFDDSRVQVLGKFSIAEAPAGYSAVAAEPVQLDLFTALKSEYSGRDAGQDTSAPLRRDSDTVPARRGIRIRALGIANDLRREGAAALVGRTAADPGELAQIAQVYRDPRFETFRVFFTKGDAIVHSTGVSARLVREAPLLPGRGSAADAAKWITETMRSSGADGYYLLHNHPTGDPNPSLADRTITREIAARASGFRGHVVINSNKYAVIDADAGAAVHTADFGLDQLLQPSIPHDLVGRMIPNAQELAVVGKSVQRPGWLTLIGVDSRLSVRAIGDFAQSELERPQRALLGAIRAFQRRSGSDRVFLVGPAEVQTDRKIMNAIQHGILLEVIDEQGNGLAGRVGGQFKKNPLEQAQGRFVAEDGERYSIASEGIPISLRAPQPETETDSGTIGPIQTLIDRAGGSGRGQSFAEAFDRWRTRLQDKMLPLLRTQQRIEQQLGRRLTEEENPYLGEELMTGRIGARMERLTEEMAAPLFEEMRAEKVSVDELETFLYARHAPERNAQIRRINPDEFGEGEGSGMTDAEAAIIMDAVKASGKREVLQRLAARVDAINAFALDTRVEAGLLSQEEADTWRETYRFYVPLRGRAELDEATDAAVERIRRSSGIDTKGKESRRAFGRKSRANDLLAYTLLQAEEAIVRAETNRVGQSFLELAKASPDPNFWTIDKVRRVRQLNKATGTVQFRSESRIAAEDAPYTVSVKVDGEEHRITLNRDNPAAVRLADSMRNLSAQQLTWVVKYLGSVNRFLSAVNTSYNPEFVITNAFRDAQTAGVNLSGFDKKGLISGTFRDYRKAFMASQRGARGKYDGDWGKWYSEFALEGGRVYFNNIEDLGEIRKRVEQAVKDAGNPFTAKRAWHAVRGFVEATNSGVENAIRLSAYKNARELGMSKKQAASLAKNLTVNFNRHGTYGPGINAAYLFFNASIQGTARILTAMKSPRVRKALYAAVATGAALEMLNQALSGDDDDGEKFYDKISDFEKSRNLIIMTPWADTEKRKGSYIKIPLPYGYNAFFAIGRSGVEIVNGRPALESASHLLGTVVDAFNPIGGTQSLLNFISPTVVDPAVDLTRNRDYADRPIMPEQSQFGPEVPDSQRYWGSVATHWKAVTDTLNRFSGGDDVQPGAIDVSPETLEYMQGVVLGAAGSFLDRNFALTEKLLDPDIDTEANDWPMVRKLVGDKPGWYDKSAFYTRLDEVEQQIAYAKEYEEKGRAEALEQLITSKADVLSLEPTVKAARKDVRAIRKDRAELQLARELGTISDQTYRETTALLDDAERTVIVEFNKAYLLTVETPARP